MQKAAPIARPFVFRIMPAARQFVGQVDVLYSTQVDWRGRV